VKRRLSHLSRYPSCRNSVKNFAENFAGARAAPIPLWRHAKDRRLRIRGMETALGLNDSPGEEQIAFGIDRGPVHVGILALDEVSDIYDDPPASDFTLQLRPWPPSLQRANKPIVALLGMDPISLLCISYIVLSYNRVRPHYSWDSMCRPLVGGHFVIAGMLRNGWPSPLFRPSFPRQRGPARHGKREEAVQGAGLSGPFHAP